MPRYEFRKAALAALGLMVAFSTAATAGVNAFTPLGPEGGTINKVEFNPSDSSIAYLATGTGFYRSTDAGVSWRAATGSSSMIPDFAIDPADGDRIYVAGINDGGVLLSTDGGATMNRLLTFPASNYGPSNIEMSRDGMIYVTADTRVFRSADRGATWQERTALVGPVLINSLRVDPLDSEQLYVFNNDIGFRSVDGGATWQPLTLPGITRDMAIAAVTPRLVFAATYAGVMVSSNGGVNWAPAGLSDAALVIAVDPTSSDASVLYAGTYPTGLFRTANQGGVWTNVHGNSRSGEINAIAINPSQPSTILLGGIAGLARSTTSGTSWTTANTGLIATSVNRLVAVPSSNRIYVSTQANGIFSLNAGATALTPVNLDALAAVKGRINVESFDLLAQGPSPDRLFVGMNGGFARSTDGGDHWQWISTMGSGAVTRFASPVSQPQVVLAAAYPGLHRSIDGGTTWDAVNGLPANADAQVMTFAPASASVVYAAITTAPVPPESTYVPRGIYKSTNGGIDWVAASTGLPSAYVADIAVDPRSDQTAYVATSSGLFKTMNGGDQWTALGWNSGTPAVTEVLGVAVDALRPDTIYATQFGRVGRSIDAGATWENLHSVAAGSDGVSAVLADPSRANTLIVGTNIHGAVEMTLASDVEIEGAVPVVPTRYDVPATYTYTVRNLGPFHATDLRTVIQLPASAVDVAATATAGTCVVQAAAITCTQPFMLAGRATQITVTSGNVAGDAEVVATVQSSMADTAASNNSVRTTLHFDAVADLSVTVSAPAAVTEGNGITYSVVAANAGPNDASGVTATLQLAAGLTAAAVSTSSGTCTSSATGLVVCTIASLPNGASATISVATAAAPAGTYPLSVAVKAAGSDPVAANDSATATTTANVRSTTGSGGKGSRGGGGSIDLIILGALLLMGAARRQRRSLRM